MTNGFGQKKVTRRVALGGLFASGLSFLSGCTSDGQFSLFGYSSCPRFNPEYKTIYVPIFRNKAFQTTPYRGVEMELTRAVILEIEQITPMKVISDPNRADTELLGTIVTLTKNLINRTQQNEVREGEVVLSVELVWRDLRTNKVLSNPRRPTGLIAPGELPPFDPDNPPQLTIPDAPIPVLLSMSGRYLPEVGESNASAQQRVCKRLARQIVNMMEQDPPRPPRPAP